MNRTPNQDNALRIEETAHSFLTVTQINDSGRLHKLRGSLYLRLDGKSIRTVWKQSLAPAENRTPNFHIFQPIT